MKVVSPAYLSHTSSSHTAVLIAPLRVLIPLVLTRVNFDPPPTTLENLSHRVFYLDTGLSNPQSSTPTDWSRKLLSWHKHGKAHAVAKEEKEQLAADSWVLFCPTFCAKSSGAPLARFYQFSLPCPGQLVCFQPILVEVSQA